MEIRVPGLPVKFELNALNLVGMLVFSVGAVGYGSVVFGFWDPGPGTEDRFLGVALFGILVYAIGRVLWVVAWIRRRRKGGGGS